MTALEPDARTRRRAELLVALDQFIAYHFGMAVSAFPGSLVSTLLDELPDVDALTDAGWRAVVMRRLSINETHFLRQSEHFSLLERIARVHRETGEKRPFRVWSAACSTGEEVWTIVSALRAAGLAPAEAEVLGSDLNPDVVEKARLGQYRRWSMRGVEAGQAEAWLAMDGERVSVRDELRPYATFMMRNLMDTPYPTGWDVIFCRNVMIYLRPDAVQQVCQAAFDALRPGGAFFIAATDPMPDVSIGFEEVYVGSCRFYRKPGARIDDGLGGRIANPVSAQSYNTGKDTISLLESLRRTNANARSSLGIHAPPVGPALRSTTPAPASRASVAPRLPAPPVAPSSLRPPALSRPAASARPIRVPSAPRAAVELEPVVAKVEPCAVCGLVEMSRAGQPRRALALLSDLVEEHPEDAQVRLGIVEVAHHLGMFEIAIEHARQAFFLKPDEILPNYWVGALLAITGQSPFGRARLKKAERLLAGMDVAAPIPLSVGWTAGEIKRRLEDANRN